MSNLKQGLLASLRELFGSLWGPGPRPQRNETTVSAREPEGSEPKRGVSDDAPPDSGVRRSIEPGIEYDVVFDEDFESADDDLDYRPSLDSLGNGLASRMLVHALGGEPEDQDDRDVIDGMHLVDNPDGGDLSEQDNEDYRQTG